MRFKSPQKQTRGAKKHDAAVGVHGELLPGAAKSNGAAKPNAASNGALIGSSAAAATAAVPQAPTRARLGDLLVQRGLLTSDAIDRALAAQPPSDKRVGETLIDLRLVDERNVVDALAQQFGVTPVDLRHERPEADALGALPEASARELSAIPMCRRDGVLEIAVGDPTKPGLATELARAAGGSVKLLLAPASEVRRAIDQSYRALAGVERHVREFELTSTAPTRGSSPALQQAVDGQAPVVQVVNLIVTQALRDRASDVHIEPMGSQIRVRMRVDGALHDVLTLPADMGPAIVSRIKVMSGMNIVERRRAQDGQFETSVDNRALDVRVSTTPVIHGEKTVLRLLDKSRSLYKMSELGMPAHATAAFSELLRSPFGMVLCAGPTGSGKTTTLYAALAEINTTERNIMTVEDPVEYVLPTVNQIQINETADITFAGGLKSILRQDPDVILVGEIRDVETARIAVQSALTGHFVLSSLQRLVRRMCRECTVAYRPPADEISFYESIGGTPKQEFFHGAGCNFCSDTGYQERIGVYEVLRMTDAMRELIVEQPAYSDLRKLAISEGMRPLRDEALRLVAADVTTIPEILRSVYPL